jgi:hypothetical protein
MTHALDDADQSLAIRVQTFRSILLGCRDLILSTFLGGKQHETTRARTTDGDGATGDISSRAMQPN